MFDKIKNIFKSDKEESNVTPKNAPKEVTVPAHKIGPKSQDDTTTYVIIGASSREILERVGVKYHNSNIKR